MPPSGLPGDAPTPDRSKDPRVYVRILDYVRGLIDDGLLRPGTPIPTIDALTRQFGCARQTCAKALHLLEDEGLLIRYPGLGYYVAEQP